MATNPQAVTKEIAAKVEENLLSRMSHLPVKEVIVESTFLRGSHIRVILKENVQWSIELRTQVQEIIEDWKKSLNTPALAGVITILPDYTYLNNQEELESIIEAEERLKKYGLLKHKRAIIDWAGAELSVFVIKKHDQTTLKCMISTPLKFYETNEIRMFAKIEYAPSASNFLVENDWKISLSENEEQLASLTIKDFGSEHTSSNINANSELKSQLLEECRYDANEKTPEILEWIAYSQYARKITLPPNIAN